MARKPKGEKIDGWLTLDKPAGLTSSDCVNRARRLFNAQKAGHAGTLDPMATWTSGEPVSPWVLAFALMTSALRSLVIDIGCSFSSRG